MPIAALISNKIFCMHGGLPKDLNLTPGDWSQIEDIKRPYDTPPFGIICDLLWADPGTENGFHANSRGVSYLFGPDVLQIFCVRKDIDMLVRAHQVVEKGFELAYDTEHKARLVTVFSAPNYCGEFLNRAAIMKVAANLRCAFSIIKPVKVRTKASGIVPIGQSGRV